MNVRIDLPDPEGKLTRLEMTETSDNRWIARCRIPINGALSIRDIAPQTQEQREAMQQEIKSDEHRDLMASDMMVLEGIASSSNVDWHGTEMSRDALEQMATQFKSGVPYVRSHNEDEWDDMLGRTFDAQVVASEQDGTMMLKVATTLYLDDLRSKSLLALLKRSVPIGWSIGGWFTELEVVTDDNDEIEAMIVRGVELDHLATTRRPSNPDSWIFSLADAGDALRAARSRTTAAVQSRPDEQRHVWKVVETDENIHVVFGKASESEWQGVHSQWDGDDDVETDSAPQYPELAETRDETADVKTRQVATAGPAVQLYQGMAVGELGESWVWNDAESDSILGDERDWQRYQMAHLLYDASRPNERDAYQYPFARMIDGELVAVFDAVRAVLDMVNDPTTDMGITELQRSEAYEHLVRYYREIDEEPPRYYFSRDARSSASEHLDSAALPCSNTHEGLDAHRSASSAPDLSNPITAGDAAMSDNNTVESAAVATNEAPQTDRLDRIEALLMRTVEAMAAKPEQAPAPVIEQTPAPETNNNEVELRERINALEATIVRMSNQPKRAGRTHMATLTRHAPASQYESMVRTCEKHLPQGSALASVCRDQSERRAAGLQNLPSRSELEHDLRAVLHAAFADGLISDPDQRAAWS